MKLCKKRKLKKLNNNDQIQFWENVIELSYEEIEKAKKEIAKLKLGE